MRLSVTADGEHLALLEQALAAPLGEEPRGPDGESGGEPWGEAGIDPDLVVGADQLAELEDWMAGAADWDSKDWGEVTMDVEPTDQEVGRERPDTEWPDSERPDTREVDSERAEGVQRSLGFRSDAGPVIDLQVGIGEPAVPADARKPAVPADAQPVELKILGPVEVIGGAGPDSVPASRRASALAVICYLATRTRPVSADQIATALWPADVTKDNFGEPRRKTVMNVISRARLLLGESTASSSRLLLTERGYTLSDEVTCDWTRFQDLIDPRVGTAGEVAAGLKEALELVGGEPFTGSLSRPFYEWVGAEHLDLAMVARVVDTAERLGRLALDSGDHDTAEWAVQKGLALDPAREELFQVWMHVAGRAGRPDRVDDIYRRLCRSLQRHIDAGLSPSEASELVRSAYCVRPTRV